MLLQSRQWNKTVLPFLSLCLNKSSSKLPFRIFPISWARNWSNSKKNQRELWFMAQLEWSCKVLYGGFGQTILYSIYITTVWIKITCQIRQHIKYLNISMRCSCHKNRFFIFVNNSKNLQWSYPRLHRYWLRMLETKCVGDNYEMLVKVLAILVTNIHYLFT